MWPYVLGFVGLFVAFLLFGLWFGRKFTKQAVAELEKVELADIPFLCEECVRTFQEKFGKNLSLDDFEGASQLLEDAFGRGEAMKRAFARQDFYYYFVKPVGAFLGELLRLHTGHQWRKDRPGSPYLVIEQGENSAECFPFEKVLRTAGARPRGELYAYLMAGKEIGKAVATGHLEP